MQIEARMCFREKLYYPPPLLNQPPPRPAYRISPTAMISSLIKEHEFHNSQDTTLSDIKLYCMKDKCIEWTALCSAWVLCLVYSAQANKPVNQHLNLWLQRSTLACQLLPVALCEVGSDSVCKPLRLGPLGHGGDCMFNGTRQTAIDGTLYLVDAFLCHAWLLQRLAKFEPIGWIKVLNCKIFLQQAPIIPFALAPLLPHRLPCPLVHAGRLQGYQAPQWAAQLSTLLHNFSHKEDRSAQECAIALASEALDCKAQNDRAINEAIVLAKMRVHEKCNTLLLQGMGQLV